VARRPPRFAPVKGRARRLANSFNALVTVSFLREWPPLRAGQPDYRDEGYTLPLTGAPGAPFTPRVVDRER
jgi:hypothetical protein